MFATFDIPWYVRYLPRLYINPTSFLKSFLLHCNLYVIASPKQNNVFFIAFLRLLMSNTIVVPLAIFWSKTHLTQSFLESVEGNIIRFFVKAITSISSGFWPKDDQKAYLKKEGQIQVQQLGGHYTD